MKSKLTVRIEVVPVTGGYTAQGATYTLERECDVDSFREVADEVQPIVDVVNRIGRDFKNR